MTEWNPVKGLEEIKYEDLREGDEVVMFSFNEYYRRVTIDHIGRFGYNNKYYLLQRPVEEPINRGDVVKIPWERIVRKSRENSNYRLRSYRATYRQVE